ncbi:MAG: hypothetical protein ACW98D_07845 [Promethearchaeota archaeon]|jgi:hypothetical protein
MSVESVVFIVLEVISFIFFAITEVLIIRSYRESKNKIYYVLIVYFAALLFISLFRLTNLFNLTLDLTFGARLSFSNIFALMIFNIQSTFILYLKNLKKLYTLPYIASFYIGFGLIASNTLIALIFYATLIGLVIPLVLLREGSRSRNGLAFGLGLFFLIYGVSKMIQIEIISDILRIIGGIVTTLATIGFFEKYIFVDKDQEEKMKGAWISKLVEKK